MTSLPGCCRPLLLSDSWGYTHSVCFGRARVFVISSTNLADGFRDLQVKSVVGTGDNLQSKQIFYELKKMTMLRKQLTQGSVQIIRNSSCPSRSLNFHYFFNTDQYQYLYIYDVSVNEYGCITRNSLAVEGKEKDVATCPCP